MKKIHDLKSERSLLISAMEAITAQELTMELRSEYDANDVKVKSIDEQIAILMRQEELNKHNVRTMENTITLDEKSLGVRFREFLLDPLTTSFRVEPMLSTSNTDIIPHTIKPIDELYTPGEEFLRTLGVTIYKGLVGQVVLPSKSEHTATFVAENVSGADSSMNIVDVVMNPGRISDSFSVTREFLANTNPDIFAALLANSEKSIWNGVVAKFFTDLVADTSTQTTTTGVAGTYKNILDLEAALGCYSLDPKIVTSPTAKAYLKGTIALGTTSGAPMWVGNEMNGYNAYSTCALTGNKVVMGDFSHAVVGQWSGIEVIKDIYTLAKIGRIQITVLGLFDVAVSNPAAFAVLDASLA